MKLLKIFTFLLVFVIATGFIESVPVIEKSPVPEYKILMYANGNMATITDGNDCWEYLYENPDTGDFELFYVWCR